MFETLSLLMLSASAGFMFFLYRLNRSAQQEAKDGEHSTPTNDD